MQLLRIHCRLFWVIGRALTLCCFNRGLPLDEDPDFLERSRIRRSAQSLEVSVTTLGKELPKTAKMSVVLFFGGILTIVVLVDLPATCCRISTGNRCR